MAAAVAGGVPVKPPLLPTMWLSPGSRHLRNRPTMAVRLNIPLRLPLCNAIRQPIHRRSIAASAPLLPAKATEGLGAVLLLRTLIGTVAVVTTAILRRGPRDITVGAAASTAGWKLQDISSGSITRFCPTENGGKKTTEIPFILVAPVLSRKGDTVSSVACLLHSSMVAAIRCSRRP